MSIVIVMESLLKPFVLTRGLTTPMLITSPPVMKTSSALAGVKVLDVA
jgi:hypothetical protein